MAALGEMGRGLESFQAARAKVGILRPEDNITPVEINGGIQRRGAVHIPPEERESGPRHDAVISRRPAHVISLLKFRVYEAPHGSPSRRLNASCPCWSPTGSTSCSSSGPLEQSGGVCFSGLGEFWSGSRECLGHPGRWVEEWLVSNFFFGGLRTPDGRRAQTHLIECGCRCVVA